MRARGVSASTKGQLLGEKQMIQDMIAQSSADIRALRLHGAAQRVAVGHAGRVEDPRRDRGAQVLGRARCSTTSSTAPSRCTARIGWTMDLPLAKMYVLARQMRIADGADEVHKSFVANKRA